MNLFLAYLNCIDDWEDEKKLSRKIYTLLVKNKVRKIKNEGSAMMADSFLIQ